MKKFSLVLTATLFLVCGCGSKSQESSHAQQPGSQSDQTQGHLYYSLADLNQITTRHPGISLPTSLVSFLTDPNFTYNVGSHYDLGIEGQMGFVLYLDPVSNSKDKAFLQTLEQDYPTEISAMRADPRLYHPSFPNPMSLTNSTRFADNNIASFLDSCTNSPVRSELMRKVIFHILIQ